MALWYGKYASVCIGTAITSIGTTSSLWTQATTATGVDYSAECKELVINPGEAGVDPLQVYGSTLIEEARPELVTADFTMVFTDVDLIRMNFATSTAFTGYERWVGQDTTGNKTKRCIGFKLAASSIGTLNVLMNNAYITAQGEITLAADGSAEQTLTAKCVITDFYVEDFGL
jgi:hypothetical protein